MANDIGDDNIIGAYCHVPIIGGFLVPLIVYFVKKDDNAELGFQAKQALVYQITIGIIMAVLAIGIGFLSVGAAVALGDLAGIIVPLLYLVLGLICLVFLVFAVLAAWKTFNKEHYEYPIIGAKLR